MDDARQFPKPLAPAELAMRNAAADTRAARDVLARIKTYENAVAVQKAARKHRMMRRETLRVVGGKEA